MEGPYTRLNRQLLQLRDRLTEDQLHLLMALRLEYIDMCNTLELEDGPVRGQINNAWFRQFMLDQVSWYESLEMYEVCRDIMIVYDLIDED